MIAFEVYHNGKHLCTAGVGDYGLLNADVAWKLNDAAKVAKGQPASEVLNVVVAGFAVDGTRHRWVSAPLCHGDEILVRICETSAVDAPSDSRPPMTREDVAELRRDHVRRTCREFGWTLIESSDE